MGKKSKDKKYKCVKCGWKGMLEKGRACNACLAADVGA